MGDPDFRDRATNTPAGLISTRTIGDAWIGVAAKIIDEGAPGEYDGLAPRELIMTTLQVTDPQSDDALIDEFAEPEHLAWMRVNFTDSARVAVLGGADSYATRLYDYEHPGLNQIDWVIDRLRRDPSYRSATITTFQPLSDASYIPCVSLLDFFITQQRLSLVVFAHSIDFGTKGFANLVELAHVQQHVAERTASDVGSLTMIVKSAHVYDDDVERLKVVLSQCAANN
ncbi:MAG: thymidylate synthase [Acidimicrobiales bacterium]